MFAAGHESFREIGRGLEQQKRPVFPFSLHPPHRIGRHSVHEALPCRRLLRRHQPRQGLQDRHLDAEPGKHLGELEPDGAAANDDQGTRETLERHRSSVVEVAGLSEPGKWRGPRGGASGDDDLLAGDRPPISEPDGTARRHHRPLLEQGDRLVGPEDVPILCLA